MYRCTVQYTETIHHTIIMQHVTYGSVLNGCSKIKTDAESASLRKCSLLNISDPFPQERTGVYMGTTMSYI